VVTVDGQVYEVGDYEQLFTIQSISKAFVYGLALEEHGRDYVLTRVVLSQRVMRLIRLFSWRSPRSDLTIPWSMLGRSQPQV
jgi:hypothetical protein